MTQLLKPRMLIVVAWFATGVPAGAPPAWLAVGALALLLLLLDVRPGADDLEQQRREDELALRRQLAIARRRGHPVDLLRASIAGLPAAEVSTALRISDFALLDPRRDGALDLVALMDGPDCDRTGVEGRLRGLGGDWSFGWSRFPDDGATLDALVDNAIPASHSPVLHTTTEDTP